MVRGHRMHYDGWIFCIRSAVDSVRFCRPCDKKKPSNNYVYSAGGVSKEQENKQKNNALQRTEHKRTNAKGQKRYKTKRKGITLKFLHKLWKIVLHMVLMVYGIFMVILHMDLFLLFKHTSVRSLPSPDRKTTLRKSKSTLYRQKLGWRTPAIHTSTQYSAVQSEKAIEWVYYVTDLLHGLLSCNVAQHRGIQWPHVWNMTHFVCRLRSSTSRVLLDPEINTWWANKRARNVQKPFGPPSNHLARAPWPDWARSYKQETSIAQKQYFLFDLTCVPVATCPFESPLHGDIYIYIYI